MKKSTRSSQSITPAPVVAPEPTPTPERSPLPRISFKERRKNRALPTESVLNLLRAKPRCWELAEVVGKWIWIAFTEQPPREVTATLSQLGFHWNNTRRVWQHPCGTITESTPLDPRQKYHSYFAADMKLA